MSYCLSTLPPIWLATVTARFPGPGGIPRCRSRRCSYGERALTGLGHGLAVLARGHGRGGAQNPVGVVTAPTFQWISGVSASPGAVSWRLAQAAQRLVEVVKKAFAESADGNNTTTWVTSGSGSFCI